MARIHSSSAGSGSRARWDHGENGWRRSSSGMDLLSMLSHRAHPAIISVGRPGPIPCWFKHWTLFPGAYTPPPTRTHTHNPNAPSTTRDGKIHRPPPLFRTYSRFCSTRLPPWQPSSPMNRCFGTRSWEPHVDRNPNATCPPTRALALRKQQQLNVGRRPSPLMHHYHCSHSVPALHPTSSPPSLCPLVPLQQRRRASGGGVSSLADANSRGI